MRSRLVTLLFVLFVFGASARAQIGSGSLDGRWRDDLNRQSVLITVAGGKITAAYEATGKTCRYPDRAGRPVPFRIDFDGTVSGAQIRGLIYYCKNHAADAASSTTYTES